VGGAGLAYPADTTTLRLAGGTVTITRGPLLASDVHLTAYYLVSCSDETRAREIATGILDFHVTVVEVRPVHDSAGTGRAGQTG
jgi:hypothetical protein